MQVDKAHGGVPHGEKEAQDWAVSSSQLSRHFMVKHVRHQLAVSLKRLYAIIHA